MKRLIAIVLSVLLSIFSSCFIYSLGIHENKEMTIIFNVNSTFSESEKKVISEKLRGRSIGGGEQPNNIICNIFGHSYTEELVTAITHKVYPTQPRCKEEVFKVNVCTRCSDTQTELISDRYIVCCQ